MVRSPSRAVWLTAALVVVFVLVATIATAVVRGRDGGDPGQRVGTGPAGSGAPPAADRPVRLGGLGMLVSDDPMLAGCTGPRGGPPPAAGSDPLAAVQARTERIRGLQLATPVEIDLLDDEEMTRRVAAAFGPQWDDDRIDLDTRMLLALGAIEPGTDLRKLRVDVFAEQVSGYFLGSRNVIAARTRDPDALSPTERVVLSHEFEHAMTYQRLARPEGDTPDAARAASAVVEGSAALTMRMYAQSALTGADQVQLHRALLARAAAGELASYSPYLLAELRFPYVEGARFLCDRFRDGGWAAVNAAYADPPRTTAGVLFPDRADDRPRSPEETHDPGDGWRQARTSGFGAAELLWLLSAPGGEPEVAAGDARARAAAWAGGEVTVWTDDARSAVGLALVDGGGGPPLCDTVRDWYRAAFPDAVAAGQDGGGQDGGGAAGVTAAFDGAQQDAALVCEADQVRLGVAPDLAAASAIAG